MLKKSIIAAVILASSSISVYASTNTPNSPLSITEVGAVSNIVKAPYQVKESDYTVLNETLNIAPVTEFFSFRCAYCYLYDKDMQIGDYIVKNALDGKADFARNNIDYAIQDSADITLSYAMATLRGPDFEKKFREEMFKGFHESNSIQSAEDIFKIFSKLGMTDEEIHQALNSKEAQSLYEHDVNIAKKLNTKVTPTFVVAGKYVLNIPSITKDIAVPSATAPRAEVELKIAEIRDRIITTIKYLLEKDNNAIINK